MKKILCIFLSSLFCLLCTPTAKAKECAEVLYVAYNGLFTGSARMEFEDLRKGEDSIPYYLGAFCIDSINKKLTYHPRGETPYLNFWIQNIASYISRDDVETIPLSFKEEYTTKGEGHVKDNSQTFIAPLNTDLFPYWVGEYISNNCPGRIVRREVNAEPELDWNPQFTDSRIFTNFIIVEEYPDLNWTDDKGRSGP